MLRGELPPGYSQYIPAVGSCVVYNTIPADPFPNITRTALDAGPSIVASGPNGTAVATRFRSTGVRADVHSGNLSNTYVNAGSYTFTGTGGPDVGAFTDNLEVLPDLVVLNNPEDFRSINRSNSVTVRWSGGDPNTFVQVQGFSYTVSASGAPAGNPTVFHCLANNTAGQFTVPASVLSQLPASGSFTASGLTFVVRGSIAVAKGSRGTRIIMPGLDYGTAANQSSWAYQPRYQ
jgi:hypothetical protein